MISLEEKIKLMEEYIKNKQYKTCGCSCHKHQAEASLKNLQAKAKGEFYYYHEDCYCCSLTFGLGDYNG